MGIVAAAVALRLANFRKLRHFLDHRGAQGRDRKPDRGRRI